MTPRSDRPRRCSKGKGEFDEGHIPAPQDGAGGDSGSRTWVPGEVWKFFTQFQTSNPITSGTLDGTPCAVTERATN
jgi:hypothetical protein